MILKLDNWSVKCAAPAKFRVNNQWITLANHLIPSIGRCWSSSDQENIIWRPPEPGSFCRNWLDATIDYEWECLDRNSSTGIPSRPTSKIFAGLNIYNIQVTSFNMDRLHRPELVVTTVLSNVRPKKNTKEAISMGDGGFT